LGEIRKRAHVIDTYRKEVTHMARSNGNGNGESQEPEVDSNIVTPVALSKELGIRPQIIFGWTRSGKLPVHYCVCGHQYLQRDEVAEFLAAKEAAREAKEAKIAAELEASEAEAVAV
jgi:hypothetical protein